MRMPNLSNCVSVILSICAGSHRTISEAHAMALACVLFVVRRNHVARVTSSRDLDNDDLWKGDQLMGAAKKLVATEINAAAWSGTSLPDVPIWLCLYKATEWKVDLLKGGAING